MIKYIKKIIDFNRRIRMSNVEYARYLGVKIGEGCEMRGNIFFSSEPYLITIGNNVRIAKNVSFFTHDGGMHVLRNNDKFKNADKFGLIKVGNNVFIGENSIIMPGVTIGDNVIIACASVVTKDVKSNTVVGGVPAKKIETLDEYYEKNKDQVDFTKDLSPEEKRKYLYKKFNLK